MFPEPLQNVLKTIEEVLTHLEPALRGNYQKLLSNKESLLEKSNQLYDLSYSFEVRELSESLGSQEKNQFLDATVKLYNKLRNFHGGNNTSLNEIKATLKASTGWLFSIFADKIPKTYSILIKTFSNAAREFSTIPHCKVKAIDCYQIVCNLWLKCCEISFHKELPPLDLRQLKGLIFMCATESIRNKLSVEEVQDVKDNLSIAIELFEGASIRHRISFISLIFEYGRRLASNASTLKEAIYYMQVARDLVERPSLLVDTTEANQECHGVGAASGSQVLALKVKILLALAFFSIEAG